MDYEQFFENLIPGHKESIIIRGVLIDRVSILESKLNAVLALHFQAIRHNDLLVFVFSDKFMTFESKYQVLKKIVKAYYPIYLTEHPTFWPKFKNIIENRNILAHLALNKPGMIFSEEPDTILISKAKDGDLENVEFSESAVNELLSKVEYCYQALHDLEDIFNATKVLPKRSTPS